MNKEKTLTDPNYFSRNTVEVTFRFETIVDHNEELSEEEIERLLREYSTQIFKSIKPVIATKDMSINGMKALVRDGDTGVRGRGIKSQKEFVFKIKSNSLNFKCNK
jgi:hypothetical protein